MSIVCEEVFDEASHPSLEGRVQVCLHSLCRIDIFGLNYLYNYSYKFCVILDPTSDFWHFVFLCYEIDVFKNLEDSDVIDFAHLFCEIKANFRIPFSFRKCN